MLVVLSFHSNVYFVLCFIKAQIQFVFKIDSNFSESSDSL